MKTERLPWFAYWVGGLFTMLIIADFAPPSVTYTLLAILLIGFYANPKNFMTPTRPDQH